MGAKGFFKRKVFSDWRNGNIFVATFETSHCKTNPSGLGAVRSKAVVLLLLTFCLLLLRLTESVIALCFVVRYFMPILVLQSS